MQDKIPAFNKLISEMGIEKKTEKKKNRYVT